MPSEKVIIIGGGPAGYTAALYLARAGVESLCIEGYAAGGQLLTTSSVENYPGFPKGISGAELTSNIREQAQLFGARFLMRDVDKVDASGRPFRLSVGGEEYSADALIIATGAKPKVLGLPSEAALANKGVAYCAVCDGPLFAGQRCAVIGGGDGAMEQALTLSRIASEVVLVNRRHEFRAAKAMTDAARAAGVTFYTPYVVNEIVGDERVTGITLTNTETGERRTEEFGAVFVAIGHKPSTELVRDVVFCDDDGYILVDPGSTRTSVEGIFAAGDVADRVWRQAITAAGTGCGAALEAERWLTRKAAAEAEPDELPRAA